MKFLLLVRLPRIRPAKLQTLVKVSCISSRCRYYSSKDGFVTIGDVTVRIKKRDSAHLVPVLYRPEHVPQSIVTHLQWMMQKDSLKQDMFLIGPPGPLRRNIAMMFLELTRREFEYMSLSRDTTESDLKQRRELVAGTAFHAEQCAVRAALQGRVLVLEGVEKAERNVLPILNNLLENREMQMEDGRFLVSPERYDKLLETYTPEQLHSMKIVRVHPDFRVIALGLPVPHYHGNPLDPPFRSRFQGRSINHLSIQDYSKLLSLEDEFIRLTDLSKLLSFGVALSTDEAKQLNLPDFPFDNLALVTDIMRRVPFMNASRLIERLYPHQLFPKEAKNAVDDLLKMIGLAQEAVEMLHLESVRCGHLEPFQANVKVKAALKEMNFEVPCGDSPSSSSSSCFVSTPFHDDLLSDLLISHSAGDFCVVGPRGCGKSSLISKFAELLGYKAENIMLYQDMTSRDLLQQRTMNSSGDTGWRHSSLVDACVKGHLAVLDGLHRVHASTLSVLQRLIHDRELDLFDGTRLLRHDRYDSMMKDNSWSEEEMKQRKLLRIHPSFRIVCLSEPPSHVGSSNWLTSELLASLLYHPMRQMTPQEESQVLRHLVPNYSRMESVLKFAQQLRTTSNSQLNSLASSMSTRQLVRLAKRLSTYEDDNILHLLDKACLTRFLPSMVREAFREELKKSVDELDDLKELYSDKEITCEVKNGVLTIGRTEAKVQTNSDAAKVPDVLFYDNVQHLRVMEDMLRDFLIGDHLLLIGNQGVGKNKVVDRFLNLLGRPREYIQLHRDTTVQTLTVQPTVRGGVVEYEDSPLVKAVKNGRILVVDEADKAPTNVTCILKCLVESGFMHLPDGRKIVPVSSNIPESPFIIKTHPQFRIIVLANRPGFPFLGNDFFGTLGDAFGAHAVDNPDPESELSMLRKYGPSVDEGILVKIVAIFGELREMADKGEVSYPFSTREAVSIVKHLEMFPRDGLANVVRNVFDFDSYDLELQNVITEVMHKHGVPIGAKSSNVKLSKEFPLPPFEFHGSLEAKKIVKDLHSEQKKFRIEDVGKFEVRKLKADSKSSRSSVFQEESEVIKFPLLDGSTAVQMAVTHGNQRQTSEKVKGDVIHVLAVQPLTLYSLDVTKNSLSFMEIESLLPRGMNSFSSKMTTAGGFVLIHDGKSPSFHLVDANSGHVQRVTSSSNKISDFLFKKSPKKNGNYKILGTGVDSGKVVFYKEGSAEMEIFDFIEKTCRAYTLPFSIGSMFPVASGDYIINESSSKRFYLLRGSLDDVGQYELMSLHESAFRLENMDFIANCSLSASQLSLSLGEKIDSPNRVISTDSLFAAVIVGMPDCMSFECFQSKRANLAASNLPSPTEVAYLPTNGIVARIVSTNQLPRDVFGKDVSNKRETIGFLEVVDVVNKTLRYISIPGSPGKSNFESWHLENQYALNKLSKSSNPNSILLAALSWGGLCSLDKLGHLRIWELLPISLSESLKRWKSMIGEGERPLQITHEKELGKVPTELPKHGLVDPTGAPHFGGSTFAGGSGGMGTAGLGGVGGPYRLDGGGDVYQVSDEDKTNVPPEILEAARKMALRAWKERLKEIEMSEHHGALYEQFISSVRPNIRHLRTILDSLKAKSKERQWLRHQTHGDVDEGKLIEGVIGEKGVYKRRGEREPEAGSFQEKPKLMRLVCDVSGSMYRFNGHDGRMDRQVESLLMVMEAFEGYEQKIVYEVFGHSGEGPSFPFVKVKGEGSDGRFKAPKNDKQRLDVALSLVAHSQFCLSGDHTLEATKVAIDNVSNMEDMDEKFVIILSDANIERYGINPVRFGHILTSNPDVNAYVIFIGSLGNQAQRLLSKMPAGHSFICRESKHLPGIMHQIFLSSLLK